MHGLSLSCILPGMSYCWVQHTSSASITIIDPSDGEGLMTTSVHKGGTRYWVRRTKEDPKDHPVFYGVELEMSAEDERDFRYAEDRALSLLDFVDVGRDCSGANIGMEFRFDPCTYNFWSDARYDVADFMEEMVNDCWLRSDEMVDAGLHIHINNDAFTRLHLYKFMDFIYGNRSFSFDISRRSNHTLSAWATLSEAEKRTRKAKDFKEFNYGFGEAVCLQETTVEVRLFQGTENTKEFYQSLEFVDALVEYTRDESLRRVCVDGLLEFTHGHKNRYPDFFSWVEDYS